MKIYENKIIHHAAECPFYIDGCYAASNLCEYPTIQIGGYEKLCEYSFIRNEFPADCPLEDVKIMITEKDHKSGISTDQDFD